MPVASYIVTEVMLIFAPCHSVARKHMANIARPLPLSEDERQASWSVFEACAERARGGCTSGSRGAVDGRRGAGRRSGPPDWVHDGSSQPNPSAFLPGPPRRTGGPPASRFVSVPDRAMPQSRGLYRKHHPSCAPLRFQAIGISKDNWLRFANGEEISIQRCIKLSIDF